MKWFANTIISHFTIFTEGRHKSPASLLDSFRPLWREPVGRSGLQPSCINSTGPTLPLPSSLLTLPLCKIAYAGGDNEVILKCLACPIEKEETKYFPGTQLRGIKELQMLSVSLPSAPVLGSPPPSGYTGIHVRHVLGRIQLGTFNASLASNVRGPFLGT